MSIKVEEEALELARQAAAFLGESVVDYCSRVLREQARRDLVEGARKVLREDEARQSQGERAAREDEVRETGQGGDTKPKRPKKGRGKS